MQSMPTQQQVFAGLAFMTAVLVTDSRWRAEAHEFYEMIELVGVILIATCVLGRSWYLYRPRWPGPAGKSIEAGPLYLFSCLGAAGVAAQTGGLLATLVGFMVGTFIFSHLREIPMPHGTQRPTPPKIDPSVYFFAAVPLADLAEQMQAAGLLPVLLLLP
jgi:hypothetical protein